MLLAMQKNGIINGEIMNLARQQFHEIDTLIDSCSNYTLKDVAKIVLDEDFEADELLHDDGVRVSEDIMSKVMGLNHNDMNELYKKLREKCFVPEL